MRHPRPFLLSAAAAAATTLAAAAVLRKPTPSPTVLSSTAATNALTPSAALRVAAQTQALILAASVRSNLQTYGLRTPKRLERHIANLLRMKARMLASPVRTADPVLLHVVLSSASHGRNHAVKLLRSSLSSSRAPVLAIELDVSELAGDAAVLGRYGKHLLHGARRLQKYIATRGDLLIPEEDDSSKGLPESDVHLMEVVLEALGILVDVAVKHGVGVVLACDVRGLEQSDGVAAQLAVTALVGVMARVYGPSVPFFVNAAGLRDLEMLDLLSDTMLAIGKGAEAAVFLSGGCGENQEVSMEQDSIGLLGVQCASVESMHARFRKSFRVVYNEGVADLQIARLRALKHVHLVRREVAANSVEDENRVLCDWVMGEDSKRCLALEMHALWRVAYNKVLAGK